jgi:hypothetical protein
MRYSARYPSPLHDVRTVLAAVACSLALASAAVLGSTVAGAAVHPRANDSGAMIAVGYPPPKDPPDPGLVVTASLFA